MGCGVSSNTHNNQISPISPDVSVDLKNGTAMHSKPSSAQSQANGGRTDPTSTATTARFLSFWLPCRFYGSNSASMANVTAGRQQMCSTHVQTESDILGFKCQACQTDSLILSDAELEAMMNQLESELKNVPEECRELRPTLDHESDIEDEFECESGLKSWKGIIRAHKLEEPDPTKRFANIAVQATRPTATNSTQTKFGSIDHQFVANSHKHFLEPNQLLTMTLSENLLKVIEQPSSLSSSLNEHLSSLLTSFDDEDDYPNPQLPNGEPDKMVDTIQKTLANYDTLSRKPSETVIEVDNCVEQSTSEVVCEAQVEPVQSEEILPVTNKRPIAMMDARKRLKEAQKRLKLLKQQKFNDCLELILDEVRSKKTMEDLLPQQVPSVKKRDVSLQTTNDILTDEAPHFAARPPLCHKNEMIPSTLMFRDIDRKVYETTNLTTVQEIGQFVSKQAKNDLFKIRALFIWMTANIKYNSDLQPESHVSSHVIQTGEGNSEDFCNLFTDLCRAVGVRVKTIEGFVRRHDYRPGHHFRPVHDAVSSWNAVFVLSSWRFIDLTLAAGYTDSTAQFHQSLNEHYFLTDPNLMIWTHFPYSQLENDYERWQLLDKPYTLDQFNSLPKVTEYFFEYSLSMRSKLHNPLQFRISTDIKIGSHEAMRYKYKLYPAEELENSSLNHYVFCQLKEERLVGSFMISPPMEGRFILKIFAKPEREMHGSQQDLSAALNPVMTILLDCTKARKYIEPLPISELPWGQTQKFYDFKLKLVNQKGPTIVTWGGRRRLVIDATETMLLTYSLFDSESMEMDARTVVSREDLGLKTTLTINPPRVGTFKLMLFGMPKPKQKGKWRLPLLATFLIDCKLIKPLQHDEDMQLPLPNTQTEDSKNNKKTKK